MINLTENDHKFESIKKKKVMPKKSPVDKKLFHYII